MVSTRVGTGEEKRMEKAPGVTAHDWAVTFIRHHMWAEGHYGSSSTVDQAAAQIFWEWVEESIPTKVCVKMAAARGHGGWEKSIRAECAKLARSRYPEFIGPF